MNNRKKIRLDSENYVGIRAYSITICTYDRRKLFVDSIIVKSLLEIIEATLVKDFDVYIYTFMPDHLHLLMVGGKDNSDLQRLLKLFKQKSGYWFKQKYGENLWQESYYDRILRKEESYEEVAWYILNNPVRAGLCSDPFSYKFSGSFLFDNLEFLRP